LPVFVVPPSPPRSTLSLHDALPICQQFHDLLDLALMLGRERIPGELRLVVVETGVVEMERAEQEDVGPRNALERILTGCCTRCLDRKSTRLNSSHVKTSYAVFCLK